jgi:hypothetical protein
MKKTSILTILFVFLSVVGFSQTLYDLKWTHRGTEFSGLMVFFNEDDIYMRTGYEEDGLYNVVHTEYHYSLDEEMGDFVFMEALKTTFIQDEGANAEDVVHFMWVTDEDGEMSGPFAITQYELENNAMEELVEVVLTELNPADLTPTYLSQYFLTDESEYELLVASSHQEEYKPPVGSGPINLHFVVVANTKIADIGASVKVDMDNLNGELSGIAEVLKMNYKMTEVSGKDFTKPRLLEVLNELNPSSNDMVVFYYSGHGFRYNKEENMQYPQLDMRYNAYQEMGAETTINLKDIYDVIQTKGGRLNIVLGDCCNNEIGTTRQVGTNFMAARANVNANVEKLTSLFIHSKGNIIAAGADMGEYSWCSSQGGFFTNSFISAIREETSALRANDVPSWDDIITKSKTATRKKSDLCKECDEQNVIFEKSISQ